MINLLVWNLRNLVGEQLAANQQLLYSLVHAAFENLQVGDADISKALTIAFESLPSNSLLVVNPETEAIAAQCIKHAAIELDLTAEGKLLFAIKLIQLIRAAGLCDELIAILEGAFELSKSKQTAATACWRIACAAASSVCDIEPARLLLLPIDCEPASLALQHASINRGWFVYASRILDCEGTELASLKFASPVSASPHGADLSFIVNQLTKNLRERLSLYLLAISPQGGASSSDSLKSVYSVIVRFYEDMSPDLDRDSLRNVLPSKKPSFETWRKSLQRIERQFADDPACVHALKQIGLYRKSSR